MSKYLKELKEILDENHHLVHGKNIFNKANDSQRKTDQREEIINFIPYYLNFCRKILEQSVSTREKTATLNKYKAQAEKFSTNAGLLAQDKFLSSIIEEFICQSLIDAAPVPKGGEDAWEYGSAKVYSSMHFSHNPVQEGNASSVAIKISEKDQDVSIYRSRKIILENGGRQERTVRVPIVCIECKTYLDKTMYEGSVSTAMRLKQGNPQCLFFIVCETYAVADDVDLDPAIDNIYILRKQKSKKELKLNLIQADVIEHMINRIKNSLSERIQETNEMIARGYFRKS